MDIPFIMQEDHNDISVVYVHGMVDEMELSDVMLMAYWEKDEYDSWDEYKESLNTANQRMYDLAKAAMQGPDEILKEQLRRLANGFYPEIQKPSSPITVVPRDGHTTITYDPAGTSDK